MTERRSGKSVSRIKTGSFERRLSLTRAGLFAGTRVASHMATNWFNNKETREQRHRAMLSSQARFLVDELGRLKGSVVKIGQVMALYGEHLDRKSTRLNSSHVRISYAVFCLKKKKKKKI